MDGKEFQRFLADTKYFIFDFMDLSKYCFFYGILDEQKCVEKYRLQ